jgi:hypothetical protein
MTPDDRALERTAPKRMTGAENSASYPLRSPAMPLFNGTAGPMIRGAAVQPLASLRSRTGKLSVTTAFFSQRLFCSTGAVTRACFCICRIAQYIRNIAYGRGRAEWGFALSRPKVSSAAKLMKRAPGRGGNLALCEAAASRRSRRLCSGRRDCQPDDPRSRLRATCGTVVRPAVRLMRSQRHGDNQSRLGKWRCRLLTIEKIARGCWPLLELFA